MESSESGRGQGAHGHILLTSTGFATPAVRAAFMAAGAGLPAMTRAAVVTTASREYKERNRHAVAARDALRGFGIPEVDFVDVEFEDAARLRDYGLVYINGGDPLYLRHHLRRSGADAVLRQGTTRGALVVGTSAGAVALGPDLRIVPAFDPVLADGNDGDLIGVGLVPFTVLPHANRWRARLPELAERLRDFAAETGLRVEPLEDSEALLVGTAGTNASVRRFGPPPATETTLW